MDPNEPPEPDPREPEASGGAAYEALRRLEERLDRASDAAERLLAEATARAAAGARPSSDPPESDAPPGDADVPGAGGDPPPTRADHSAGGQKPPPAGWQTPGSSDDHRGAGDLELLANLVQSLRDLIPAELQRRLAEALRELLLALRALIDWYLERVDQRRREPADVQDIPIL